MQSVSQSFTAETRQDGIHRRQSELLRDTLENGYSESEPDRTAMIALAGGNRRTAPLAVHVGHSRRLGATTTRRQWTLVSQSS